MALTTRYTELTGCRVPVQQAPMGSVSTAALAVAVADAGGVGSITALGMTAAQVDKVLADMAARTAGVLAANFLTGDIDPEAVAAAAARVRIVDFFWADPDAAAGSTEITGAFSVCPLCATSPRARVLRSCIGALRALDGEVAGETSFGGQQITLPKGHGLPPGTAATGHIDAMAMYAGESAASITAVEPAAQIIESWSAAAQRLA